MRLIWSTAQILLLASLVFFGLLFVWKNAHAITVSNLDDETHQVVFEPTPGKTVIKDITPGHTIRAIQHMGVVWIKGKKHRIPVRNHDRLVIWGDGNIQIQKRRDLGGNS